jgi:hypothetical protein
MLFLQIKFSAVIPIRLIVSNSRRAIYWEKNLNFLVRQAQDLDLHANKKKSPCYGGPSDLLYEPLYEK